MASGYFFFRSAASCSASTRRRNRGPLYSPQTTAIFCTSCVVGGGSFVPVLSTQRPTVACADRNGGAVESSLRFGHQGELPRDVRLLRQKQNGRWRIRSSRNGRGGGPRTHRACCWRFSCRLHAGTARGPADLLCDSTGRRAAGRTDGADRRCWSCAGSSGTSMSANRVSNVHNRPPLSLVFVEIRTVRSGGAAPSEC